MAERVFKILADPHKGKQIHVTKYVMNADGVTIKIEHDVPSTTGKEVQWVQTLSSNHGNSEICKMMTRVDPFGAGGAVNTVSLPGFPGICKADDLLPFYWTAADLANGSGPGLSDSPSDPPPASGRTWKQFVTGLTEVTGTAIHHLVVIAWGYDRMADGSVRVAAIRRASKAELDTHFKALRLMYPGYTYD